MQKIKKIHQVDPEKNASQIDGQTDGLMRRTDFIGAFLERWRFDKAKATSLFVVQAQLTLIFGISK